jgi:hypothetical protein
LRGFAGVPEKIDISGSHIGPRDFLDAAGQLLMGNESAAIIPKAQMPDLSGFYRFEDFRLKGTWVYPDSFQDRWVTKRLKLQSWTIRMEDPPALHQS